MWNSQVSNTNSKEVDSLSVGGTQMFSVIARLGVKARLRSSLRLAGRAFVKVLGEKKAEEAAPLVSTGLAIDPFGRDAWIAASVNGQSPAGGIIISGFPGSAEYYVCYL